MKFSIRKLLGLAAGLGLGFAANTQAAVCSYEVVNSWSGGFQGSITITNNGTAAVNGWTIGWQYTANKITSSWNATVTGSNPYSATALDWNKTIQPGQSVSFGVQGDTNGGTVEKPVITGSVCSTSPNSSSVATSASSSIKTSSSSLLSSSSSLKTSSSIKSSSPSSLSSSDSSVSSSKSSSGNTTSSSVSSVASSACSGTSQCNWYGTLYPSCTTTTSGWGYENGKSCIANSTCASQPAPYGVVNACGVSSSAATTSSSSIKSSSSSSVIISSSSKPSTSSSKSSSSVSSTAGLTSVQLTQKMGAGWNLGNSLEAIGGETAWGNPVVTQQLINSVKAAGFKTIRIPVSWSQFSDANNFVINTAWLARVEEVVNYALNADMYVVMNEHWDNGWIQPTAAKQAYVNNRLKIMWTQIATRFQNYDDRLLFAGTNEVMVDGDYGTPTVEYYTAQNSFNQTFVDAVRSTGGKNATRFLVVQGFNTNIDHAVNFAKIPTDTAKDKLLMEVHFYDPYNFTLNISSNISQWGKNATDPSKTETWANESYVDAQFQKMKTSFVDKGVGVILGEFGASIRTSVAGNEAYRVYWDAYISKSAYNHQLVPVYWDNGYTSDGNMGIFDRNSGNQVYSNVVQAVVNPSP